MPEIRFDRVDLPITVQLHDGRAQVIVGDSSPIGLPATLIAGWTPGEISAFTDAIRRHVHLNSAVEDLLAQARRGQEAGGPYSYTLSRIVITIADRELASLPWEAALAALIPNSTGNQPDPIGRISPVIVRASPVRPRVADLPLSWPLRVVQVDPLADQKIESILPLLFHGRRKSEISTAFLLAESKLDDIEALRVSKKWPAAAVLHFDQFPSLAKPEPMLTTAAPEKPGTLGWLLRLAESWQTRLILLNCRDEDELAGARVLATAIIDRGGPAVLAGRITRDALLAIYDNLVHDQPLDQMLAEYLSHLSSPDWYPTLAIGHQRADLLRISNLAREVVNLGTGLRNAQQGNINNVVQSFRDYLLNVIGQPRYERFEEQQALFESDLESALSEVGRDVIDLSFDRESKGLFPLGGTISQAREMMRRLVLGGVRASHAAQWLETVYRVGQARVIGSSSKQQAEYFVNASLWHTLKGQWQQLPQDRGRISAGQTVHLGINIGPEQGTVQAIGAGPLLVEKSKWAKDMEGVVLEVGLTGLDFEVLGDPVQHLWLPRDRPSDHIYFALRPKKAGIAQLRFCLYYQNNVLQVYRLAAIVLASEERLPPKRKRLRLLAKALGVSQEQVGNATSYAMRVEYRLTTPVAFHQRPPRSVSIVANNLNGRTVITVKTKDYLRVREPEADLADFVDNARQALNDIAGTVRRYPFDADNQGTRAGLRRHLEQLADVGWEMYDKAISESRRDDLARALEAPGQIITAAHVSLYRVLPWALMYDREYRPRMRFTRDNQLVEHVACLAPIDNDAAWGSPCGTDPGCPLYPQNLAQRRAEGKPTVVPETVACPRHFWGFQHIIEVPPQQAEHGENNVAEQRDCVLAAHDTRMVACWNTTLDPPGTDKHWLDLEALARTLNKKWQSRQTMSHLILRDLEDPDVHLVYFYCHAFPNKPPALRQPFLEFCDGIQAPEQMTASDFNFNQRWRHHPLVFINACQSLGFRPDVVSPFVEKFVTGRGAAGVIGSEIPVWQPLAWEIASLFLSPFIAGELTAGAALLAARRKLLSQKLNPLGLAYVLYAPAHLAMDVDNDGRCSTPG